MVKKALDFIFADDEDFSLEHKLFLSATIIGTFTSVLGGIINLLLKASLLAVIVPFLLSVLLLVLYLFLRFRKIYKPFVIPGILISFLGISVIWLSNGGMNGVNVMPAIVILILGLVIVTDKNKKYVISLFILIFVVNYLIQFFYPELIKSFPPNYNFWLDSVGTFIYCSISVYLIVKFIYKHFKLKRFKSEENEAKYRVLTENMKDVVWILDAETLKYSYISPSIKKLRGYTPEEIMSDGYGNGSEIDESVFLKRIMEPRIEALRAKKDKQPIYYTDEVLQTCKDGTTVWTEIIHDYYINERSNRVELRGVTRDISDRKKSEQEIRRKNQELSNLVSEKDKFFSIIAHDLKSPLHSIVGLSEFLIKSVNENDLIGVTKYAENIRQSTRRVMDLLSNLLLWSYSQTGRIKFKPEKLELITLIDEVVMLFSEVAKQKEIRIETEISSKKEAMISTILRNLISNAIKFSFTGGIITVYAKENMHETIFQVSDSGLGMTTESIKRIFNIDENYSTPGTLKEQGTGLGLILCKEFVEKHNGKIWVESVFDKGSPFFFSIPFITMSN
jgi:PAS domain S-box-containing protein